MSLILTVLLILVLLNVLGGLAIPTYQSGAYYGYSWPGILIVVLLVYFLFGRG